MAVKGNSGQIRIISGLYRGRKLPVQDLEGLRPTTDRVKETLFNWLQGQTQGAKVLDCFAGAGALGFEALSRHAASLVLVEIDKNAARQLVDNLARLDAKAGHVVQADVLDWLANTPAEPADLVFIDPPFGKQLAAPTLSLLESGGWLSDGAWVYVEVEKGLDFTWPSNWRLHRELNAGQVQAKLFQREVTE
ncbi:16S rRNA (guanine(966)-N(2))-methyltransferase RsmD [Gallaecimonas pentaromativorans]|uniref:Ribosomal RNA small subunit methyltransferase D n=1 Tax=Gallaecimonas pentaromativorans TaxID=584787 RepID=A0A3N1P6Y7_9GAMM|nr:16S rRNA (guanine(966)-N(2))-methyltransferase RsmD [Gallaecimonas pentaromativorans]ROQ24283.1 16S rRNA m(2)G-966 methyltransferase [Gallaecimonas pentaromativorans]